MIDLGRVILIALMLAVAASTVASATLQLWPYFFK